MDFVNCGTRDAVSVRTRSLWGLALFLFCSVIPVHAWAEESHPGLQAETTYAEAVVAYNKKDYATARERLDALLKESPKNVEALQLLALIYRAQSKPDQAYGVYHALAQLTPEADRGPYYFELANLLYAKKQFSAARPLFLRSIWRKFNPTPSHLFIGLIDFNQGQLGTALEHFEYVSRDADPEMAAVGHYYTGTILLKSGAGGLGLGELLEARAAAERMPAENPSAQSMIQASRKVTDPFDKSQWFASATLIPTFDSNVALFPFTAPGATGLYTVRTNYTAGGGYVTSPMRLFQLAASVRTYGNFNLLSGTQVYNFHNFSPALYLTYKPMGRLSLGAKIEGALTFQWSTADGINYANRLFALVGDPGLFLRWQPSTRFQLQWDLGVRPQAYFSATEFSGWAPYTRVSTRVTTPYALFNPGFGLSAEFNGAVDTSWRYAAPGVELNNLFRLGSHDNLVVGAVLIGYNYPWITRLDGNLVMRVSNVWTINKYFTWLADFSYTVNSSSLQHFTYNRWTAGTGVGFAL